MLVVDYVPGQPLSVHLSRKRNFASELTDAKEMVLDPEVTHRNHGSHQDEKTERGPARDMTVTFPDGTIIAEKKAVDTFVAVVKKIGVAKVRMVVEEYNLKFCKVPVIEQLVSILSLSSRTINNHIFILKKENVISRIGSKKTGYWQVNV